MACTSDTSDYFRIALRRLLDIEGGYTPIDDGTRFGITEATARRHGYEGDMEELPLDLARSIYRVAYWQQVKGEHLAHHHPGLAWEVFEVAVNAGTWRASLWLQQLLNALNRGGELYADIGEDGVIGPVTLGALDEYYDARGEEGLDVLRALYECRQGSYYTELSRSDERFERYLYGWARKRILTDSRA